MTELLVADSTDARNSAARTVQERVRAVVREVVAPRAASVDAASEFPDEGCRALADAGLGGLLMPTDLGGSGDSTLAYVMAMEEIASACGATSTVYMTQMHCAYPILVAGDGEQKSRHIPALCRAHAWGSLGITEPEAGSDVASMRTTARRDGDEYVINGAKTFITTGDRSDVTVLFATLDRSSGRDGITAFLVERGASGFSSGPPMHKLGMRGSSTTELFFDDCRVPASNRLGPEGGGWALSMASVVKSRLSAAAQGVGLARGAVEKTRAWGARHGLLQGSDGFNQEFQFALAEAEARIAAARALLHEAAIAADRPGADPVTEVSMAKLIGTDCGMSVAEEMVDLLGPEGDIVEHEVERYARDAKVTQIYDGTNQIQRLLIARGLRPAAEASS